MNAKDHALPILGQPDDTEPWGLPELGPTTLLAFEDCMKAPALEEIVERLRAHGGEALSFHGAPPELPIQAMWAQVLQIEGQPFPFVVWTEPVARDRFQVPESVEDARWMIGVQALLDPADPFLSWRLMTGLLGAASVDVLAMLDVESEQWFGGLEFAERLAGEASTPEESMLFRIDVASATETPGSDDLVWLRTNGLHRCGRPELEMLEVPGDRLRIAHDLLEAVAGLCIARGTPDPGFPFEAGVNVNLSLQPLEPQLELLSERAVGTHSHRLAMGGEDPGRNPLLGGRAVVCGPEPVGTYRPVHRWPRESIERLLRGEGGLERTEAWTRSISTEARRRWAFLLDGLEKGLGAQVCIAMDAPEGGREQVWIEVDRADPDRVEGRLLSTPVSVPHAPGDALSAGLADVIDWRLLERGDS